MSYNIKRKFTNFGKHQIYRLISSRTDRIREISDILITIDKIYFGVNLQRIYFLRVSYLNKIDVNSLMALLSRHPYLLKSHTSLL